MKGPVLINIDENWKKDFNAKDLGSGINPAGIGDKVPKELGIYDAFGEFGESVPTTEPGKFDITLLKVTTREEAWEEISSIDFNSMLAEEPTDFDYVIAEFELTLVEGPDYGMVMPSLYGTVDHKGIKLFGMEMLPITEYPLLRAEPGEDGSEVDLLIHKGETLNGEIVGKLPKEGKALLELIYNVDHYLFFDMK